MGKAHSSAQFSLGPSLLSHCQVLKAVLDEVADQARISSFLDPILEAGSACHLHPLEGDVQGSQAVVVADQIHPC